MKRGDVDGAPISFSSCSYGIEDKYGIEKREIAEANDLPLIRSCVYIGLSATYIFHGNSDYTARNHGRVRVPEIPDRNFERVQRALA